jgi:hypothetical protein
LRARHTLSTILRNGEQALQAPCFQGAALTAPAKDGLMQARASERSFDGASSAFHSNKRQDIRMSNSDIIRCKASVIRQQRTCRTLRLTPVFIYKYKLLPQTTH